MLPAHENTKDLTQIVKNSRFGRRRKNEDDEDAEPREMKTAYMYAGTPPRLLGTENCAGEHEML